MTETRIIDAAKINFIQAKKVTSDALKFVLPVPLDANELMVYDQALADTGLETSQNIGDEIKPWSKENIGTEGIRVYNDREKKFQGSTPFMLLPPTEKDPNPFRSRAAIIINHLTEDKAKLIDTKVRELTDDKPLEITYAQFKEVEKYVREELGLNNWYESEEVYLNENFRIPGTDETGNPIYGFKKNVGKLVDAIRVDGPAKLKRGNDFMDIPAEGSVIVKRPNGDIAPVTATDFANSYKDPDGKPLTINDIPYAPEVQHEGTVGRGTGQELGG